MPVVRITPEYPRLVIASTGRVQGPRGHWLRQRVDSTGYPVIGVYRDGRINPVRVHTIVCTAFHGPRPTRSHQVAHWDGDPMNNDASNLRWATPKENVADSIRLGTAPRGSRMGNSKLTETQVREILSALADGAVQSSLADQYGVSPAVISDINIRKIWRHVT